jgi:SagB-type dehydrogenase family enzyme
MTAQWVVSGFASVSWRAGRVEITSPTSGLVFSSNDLELVRMVHAFACPRTIDDVVHELATPAPDRLRHSIADFISAGILVPAAAAETAAAHGWDSSALAYHRRSRQVDTRKLAVSSVPAIAAPRGSDCISLDRGGVGPVGDFERILATRRSVRATSSVPVRFETFSRLLWLSARNREPATGDENITYVSRPYPSGGAAYSLELYPVIAPGAVEGLEPGVYRYLPECHGLERVSAHPADATLFLQAAARSAGIDDAAIVLLVTSRFARQADVYGSLAYSLVLKEVGCLFQTLYLVAQHVGLGACALGGGAPAGRLARLLNTTELAEPVVGEFMLGHL